MSPLPDEAEEELDTHDEDSAIVKKKKKDDNNALGIIGVIGGIALLYAFATN